MPPPFKPSGFGGAGAGEPPVATPGGSGAAGDLASAVDAATKAEGALAQATEKRQRLNRDDPAVKAARTAADALRDQAAAEDRLRAAVEARVKAQAGLSSGGAAATRHNPDLDAAMGFGPSRGPSRAERETGPDGTDSRMAAALRAERELAGAMRERLGLAKALAGQPTAPAGTGAGGSRGYGGPAAVGGERAGGAAGAARPSVSRDEPTGGRRRGSLLEIHDEGRAARDARRQEERRTRFRRELEEKRSGESGGELVGGFGRAVAGGGVASALASAGQSVQAANSMADIVRDPYLTEHDRFWRGAGNIPVVGEGVSMLRDFQLRMQKAGKDVGGLTHERAMLDLAERDARYRRPSEAFGPGWHMDMRERDARLMSYSGGFNLPLRPRTGRPDEPRFERVDRPALPDARRESLADARRYREERALLPARDAEFAAKREVYALSHRSLEMDAQRARQAEEIKRLEDVRKAALRRAEIDREDGGVSQLEAKAEAADASRGILTHRQRLTQLDDEKRELDERLVGARSRQYEASRGVRQVRLGQLQQREDVARSQATNLGMMGVDGRMQAVLAKQVVDQIGIENAPSQLIGMAQAAFPEVIEQQAMKAGQKFQPRFQAMAPEEYRDDVGGITKQVDEAIAAIRAQEKSDLGRSLLDLLELVKNMSSRNVRLEEELEAFKRVYQSEQTLKR